ncbi:hypothetical protein IAU59_003829 [Kwoniella sp. CBS 9459]
MASPLPSARKSVQPIFDVLTSQRRFLEIYSPATDGRLFIKRSTTADESKGTLNSAGTPERRDDRSFSSLQNEALALLYVKQHTTIPVPNVYARFEDRGCYYLILEYVEQAIPATMASNHLHPHIAKQLEGYMKQLHALVSSHLCSFTGRPHFPARLLATETYLSHLEYPKDPLNRYVLCHGDIGWQNVMVDPNTGDIKSIIDWEYAGFYPVEVEGEYWRRWGTANPNGSELNDVDDICRLLHDLSSNGAFAPAYPKTISRNSRSKHHPSDSQQKRRSGLSFGNLRRLLRPQAQLSDGQKPPERLPVSLQAPIETPPCAAPPTPAIEPVLEAAPEEPSVSGLPNWRDLKSDPLPEEDVSSSTLSLQVSISSLQQLAEQADKLKQSILVDQLALEGWLKAQAIDAPMHHHMYGIKRGTLLSETQHLVELYRRLGAIFQKLGASLHESANPLQRFQTQQIKASRLHKEYMTRQTDMLSQGKDPTSLLQEPIYEQYTNVTGSIHSDRDQAFRDSETIKWNAMRKAAEEFLVVSHAATTLLPFTPDRIRFQVGRSRDPSRKEAEDRARDLILGGNGGWKVEVLDIEDYLLLDPKDFGVEIEDERRSELDDIPDEVLEELRERDRQLQATGDQPASTVTGV